MLKYIAKLGPQDECAEMIRNKFFVDNLATTSNDIVKLTKLYKDCSDRMDNSHFLLRSCNSNDESLRNLMKLEGRFVTHDSEYDKVLGYKYSPYKDIMKLAKIKVDVNANSHRLILSETAKVFDILSFTTPVTVRSKSLLSNLWYFKKIRRYLGQSSV